MITDVLLDGSQRLLFAGDEETIRQAFHVEGDMDYSRVPAENHVPEKTGHPHAVGSVGG